MFKLTENGDGTLSSLMNPDDAYQMNWIEGKKSWGSVCCPEGIVHTVERTILENGNLQETYCFTNATKFPFFPKKTEIGIYTTFHDNYEDADVCLKERCHTHIFCGGNSSWVMALRMGGEAPHLGLALTQGSLSCYSVERSVDTVKQEINPSNDRGDFILHPEVEELLPGESVKVVWELFWFEDRDDFTRQLLEHRDFMVMETAQCSVIKGERISFTVMARSDGKDGIHVKEKKRDIPFSVEGKDGKVFLACYYIPEETGEHPITITLHGKQLKALFYVMEDAETLAKNRCYFIARNQQYHGKAETLKGAYLIYDNEERKVYYSHKNDQNGGRERVGMGALMALYLREENSEELRESLREYVDYVYREIYDEQTGEVYNDLGRCNDYYRLYNYPWFALLQLELYSLYQDMKYLKDAYLTLCRYYKEGGRKFYPLLLPGQEMIEELEKAHWDEEANIIRRQVIAHGDWLVERGLHYPISEVDYEQSIVAPAVDCLVQAYQVSGDKKYLEEAGRQLEVLKLFHAKQPDYHQFSNAIRHWDGYWFGKEEMLGDTYPHYWSALTGVAWLRYMQASGDESDMEEVRAILRGPLCLFRENGEASCAMVFPERVNGKRGHFFDAWANDQDWALYFALKYDAVVRGDLRQSLRVGGFPFDVKLEQPNRETIAAMLEAERIVHEPGVRRYSDVEEALQELKR